MDNFNKGKVVFRAVSTDGVVHHIPWFCLDYYRVHPNWPEGMIRRALASGETIIVKDFGYSFPIPEFYNLIPDREEQLSISFENV